MMTFAARRFAFALFVLALSGCGQNDWQTFSSEALRLSFRHPAEYVPAHTEPAMTEITLSNAKRLVWKEVKLRTPNDPEGPFMVVYRSEDSAVLDYVTADDSLTTLVPVNGENIVRYEQPGMGDTVGFLVNRRKPYIGVEFVFPPDEATMMKIVSSVKWKE